MVKSMMNFSLFFHIFFIFMLMLQSSKSCGYKKYQNPVTGECDLTCHSSCKQCNGASPWQCLECDRSKYKCIREYGISCEISLEICLSKNTTTTTTMAINRFVEPSPTFFSNGFNMLIILVIIVLLAIGIFLFRQYKCSKKSKTTKKSRHDTKTAEFELERINVEQTSNHEKPSARYTDEPKSSNNPTKQNVEESVVNNTEFQIETFDKEKLDWDKRLEISSGAFGKVYKCPYRDNDECYYVAVKEPRKQKSNEAFREREFMAQLKDHPHIIKLITTKMGDNMLLVMPLRRANLSSFLEKTKGITITHKIRYCQQIAYAMRYLIFKRIVHCDLKASNILVVNENWVEISDFGKSQRLESRKRTVGTVTHTAMELLDSYNQVENSEATDIWSFGVTIWEIFNETKQSPYADVLKNITEMTLLSYLDSKNHLQTTYWPSTNDSPVLEAIATYMFQCWRRKQADRPTFHFLWGLFSTKLPEGDLLPLKFPETSSTFVTGKSLF